MAGPTPLDHFAIQNTIARYCIALDTKNFDLFSDVFTADVAADYPFTDRLQGIPAIAKAIQAR